MTDRAFHDETTAKDSHERYLPPVVQSDAGAYRKGLRESASGTRPEAAAGGGRRAGLQAALKDAYHRPQQPRISAEAKAWGWWTWPAENPSNSVTPPSQSQWHSARAHQQRIRDYLRYRTFDQEASGLLEEHLRTQLAQGRLHQDLLTSGEDALLFWKVLLPPQSTLGRLVASVAATGRQDKRLELV